MKNILVPTDFSAQAHHAFEVALQLAQRTGGNVTLLHVLESLGDNSANFSSYGGPVNGAELPNSEGVPDGIFAIKLLEVTKQRMHALLAEAAQRAPGVAVHDAAGTADLDDAILRVVAERNIELVVMGTQEHDTMEQFFNSSTTQRMVRLAPCPVLAVKHQQAQFDVRNIVFPSDFTAETANAASELQQILALFPEAVVHLLHIGSSHDQQVLVHMQMFLQQHSLPNATTHIFDASSTTTGIEQFAQKVQADLIVLPTHARSGLSRLFHSSIAENVASSAFPPVLTFHLHAQGS
ncbi:universal stress protein [Microvirga sp. STR05]|uniref:Universal stress protein n=1 Tax=Hymenobacter duratus TaxID=2771356 RepID=A0ABR8JF73_9BACT|nr:universal stress protein [Hymenobacter duratus]MBD2714228.1 universal stress protein [Hymenobacter duratus]MBR7949130.1 universal stress protein [Microvirga sp. STR05]